MFLRNQPQNQIDYYERLLKAVGSLSNLFSEAPEPYLASRATENMFCRAFEADNLSRSDASADASKDNIGFGIKTFLNGNGRSLQKIAEFNSDHLLFGDLDAEAKIIKVSQLWNERLETTKRIFGLNKLIYHCIAREAGKVLIFETEINPIDIDNIREIKVNAGGNTIHFTDNIEEYSFNNTKSTLLRRFITQNVALDVPIRVLSDPFEEIEKLIRDIGPIFSPVRPLPHIYLPLYSVKQGKKYVPPKSGLNQWNAAGRARDLSEVYIRIPQWIHRKFPNFFPPRDVPFNLMLPNRQELNAKLCQDNSKALMSNPNLALGKWLLRDVLNLAEGELLTYEKLEVIGLDAVVVYKIDSEHYDIDFTRIGSYEKFEIENNEGGLEAESEAQNEIEGDE